METVKLVLVSTYLSVSEVVLAEFLPQKPILSEGPQLGARLAQADQVPAISQALHDVQLQAGRQVSQCHAGRCGLEKEKKKNGLLVFLNHECCFTFYES